MKPGAMTVECPTCGAIIDLPVNLTLGPVVDGNVTVVSDVDTNPAWKHWETEHFASDDTGFRRSMLDPNHEDPTWDEPTS